MPEKSLTNVFHTIQFSDEINKNFGNAVVTRVTVSETKRTMKVSLSLEKAVHEEALQTLKQEIILNFPALIDVQIETNIPPILPIAEDGAWDAQIPPSSPGHGNGGSFQRNGSFRKIKVNKTIPTDRRPLSEPLIADEEICVEGVVFRVDTRVLKSGRILITFDLHGCQKEDRFNAVSVKLFASQNDDIPVKKGSACTVRGKVQYDDYAKELIIIADTIAPGKMPEIRQDNAPEKRVELHLHTTMSSLDAMTPASAYVKRAALWGHPAIAITDHGVAQAFPEAANAARGTGVKILYGTEAYLVNDLSKKEYTPKKLLKKRRDHIILFAATRTGLKNLYALISISHTQDFYRRPRLLKSVLNAHREGLIVGSACEAGEVFRAIREGKKTEEEIEEIASFYDYLEIQPLGNNRYMIDKGLVSSEEDLRNLNRRVVALGEKLNRPVVATCDTHFLDAEEEIFRKIIQAGDGFDSADDQPPLYFRTTEEMLEEFSYLGEDKAYEVVVTNTRAIADSIEELSPIPSGSYPPTVPNAEEDVKKMAMDRAYEVYGNPLPPLVAERMEQELKSIISNGFAGMYILAQKLVNRSESHGYLVGSRGSVGSSLAATMIGITEVNPLPPHYYCTSCHYFEVVAEYSGGSGFDMPDRNCPNCDSPLKRDGHDSPFELFLGFDGNKDPDIDLNFSGAYQQMAHAHTEEMLGKNHVFKSGTVASIAEKTAFGYVKKYFEARGIVKRKAEINCLVAGCTGIKRTTGQHPGGLVLIPEGSSIYEFCPVQHPANQSKSGVITTHFDYHAMEGCLFKLDILGHDVPTILHLLHKFTDVDPITVPLNDKEVMDYFTNADSLGLPEFGTHFVRQMLLETRPSTFAELVRISGLSHGTNVWSNNGQDLVKNKVATLKEIISSREDIMVFLIRMGVDKNTAFKIMESVRRGRGVTEEEAGKMLDAVVPDWYVESCRKIEYLFPKAHAVAYVLMTVRIAYYKKYHPEAFYAASFSVKSDEFDYATMCVGEDAARAEYMRLKEKETNGEAESAKDKSTMATLEMALEMYKRGIKFAPLDIYQSEVSEFKPIAENLILPPLCTVSGLGQSVAETIAAARLEETFATIEDFKTRAKVNKTVLKLLQDYKVLDGMPETDQLSLFD